MEMCDAFSKMLSYLNTGSCVHTVLVSMTSFSSIVPHLAHFQYIIIKLVWKYYNIFVIVVGFTYFYPTQ